MKISKAQGLAIIRHTLTFIGAIVIMFGYMDQTIFTELSGSIISLSGVIWSIIEKNNS